jgi:ABC-type methionine transport system ATPase subunit
MPSELVRLVGYTLERLRHGSGLSSVDLTLSPGDAFTINTDSLDDAHLLLRAIATLAYPKAGQFFFKGKQLDFSNYEGILSYKKNVGYIAADASLIANRSVYENLMFMRYYFENSTVLEMSPEVVELCKLFGVEKKLHAHPSQLDYQENRLFIIIRELSKNPDILLIERPTDFLRAGSLKIFASILRNLPRKDLALVLFSGNPVFINEFCCQRILIDKGRVTSFNESQR